MSGRSWLIKSDFKGGPVSEQRRIGRAAAAERAGVTKRVAGEAVEAVFETISDALTAGERVSLAGFGAFDVRGRAERMGYNPQTGEKIRIPATRMPVFKASKILKEAVG